MTTFNELSPAQVERLYYLSEELAESIQAVQKILRHGYESKNPSKVNSPTNRQHLEEELGQVIIAIGLLIETDDIDEVEMILHGEKKVKELGQWMHHQPQDLLDKIKG